MTITIHTLVMSMQLALAIVFAVAAWHKISNRSRFAEVLHSYDVIPAQAGRATYTILVLLLASAEIVVSTLLVSQAILGTTPVALTAAIALLSIYTLALARVYTRGDKKFDCGCAFAESSEITPGYFILRNVALISVCIFAYSVQVYHGESPALLFVALPFSLFLTFLYWSMDVLQENFQKANQIRSVYD